MHQNALKRSFSNKLGSIYQMMWAFDLLPNAYVFVKDKAGRFMHANEALVSALGLQDVNELIGRTDYDFFEPSLANDYREEDQRVMQSRNPLKDQVWLVPSMSGDLNWYLSSKRPLFDSQNNLIGIMGMMRDYHEVGSNLGTYESMSKAITYVKQHYPEKIEIRNLAIHASLSLSQFERRFAKMFQCTPGQYINRVRVHAASRRLVETSDSVGNIAIDCGFYDQSHFTKIFKRIKGTTPLKYRQYTTGGI